MNPLILLGALVVGVGVLFGMNEKRDAPASNEAETEPEAETAPVSLDNGEDAFLNKQ